MSARRTSCWPPPCWRLRPVRNPGDHGFQGWVEADMIFVSPDEYGRVETLSVREGDMVEKGAPLFTVDPDLQQNDVEMATAALTNATLASERAQSLLKTSAGTQKAVDDAEATLRTARARPATAQTRLARRKAASPVAGSVQQIYYPPGELVPAGRPVVSLRRPATSRSGFSCPRRRWRRSPSGMPWRSTATAARPTCRRG